MQNRGKQTCAIITLGIIGTLLFLAGLVCIILANVTCVFQVIATPRYEHRIYG